MQNLLITGCLGLVMVLANGVANASGVQERLDEIELPPGFSISLYADDVPNARSMTLSEQGVLYVGTRSKDVVYALQDVDGDGRADRQVVVARGLDMPNGVAWHDGDLYIAENERITRLQNIDEQLDDPPKPEVIYDQLPAETHHGWRYLAMGPDGCLYVAIGAPCNICDAGDPFASIARLRPDGSGFEIYARGVRNSVGFTWHPEDQALWFTDNGRDWLGDDLPPCELNRADRAGLHFGYPACHGESVVDPEFGAPGACEDARAPVQALGPHVAPLGLSFLTGETLPAAYQGQLLLAEHGSWNRSEKIGYRLMLVTLDGHQATDYRPFATGWLEGEQAWGRPVDVLQLPDASVLVSDDHAGVIYRITHAPMSAAADIAYDDSNESVIP